MNKHKTLKMIVCLLLALVVFVSPVMNITASAVAIELGWVTYVIISMMAAAGITFTATGGVEALQSAVEDWIDEYDEISGTTLTEIIRLNTVYRPPSNNGGPGLAIGAAGVLAFSGYLAWLLDDKFSSTDSTSNSVTNYPFDAFINGKPTIAYCTTFTPGESVNLFGDYYLVKANEIGTIIPLTLQPSSAVMVSSDFFYVINESSGTGLPRYGYFKYFDTYVEYQPFASGLDDFDSDSSKFTFDIITIANAGYHNIIGLVCAKPEDSSAPVVGVLLDDGNIIYDYNAYMFVPLNNAEISDATITVPQEVTEYLPSDGEVLDLDFDQFGDSTATNPEELAEDIKQSIIATGTTPSIVPSITADPSTAPVPTPVPTPNPSPEYEDVESLGLPALGDALMDKFPFCLPEDLGRLLNIFTAERQTPKWEVDLYAPLHGRIPMQGDTMLTIDLGEYEEIGQITRWASVIGFCLFLLVVTKEFITW